MKKTTVSCVKCPGDISALLVNGKVITTDANHSEILSAAQRIAASTGTWVNYGKYKTKKRDWTWDDLEGNVKMDPQKAKSSREMIPGINGEHDMALYQLCKMVKTKFSKNAAKQMRIENLESFHYYQTNEYSFEVSLTDLKKFTKMTESILNPTLQDLSKLGYVRLRKSGGLKISLTDKARTEACSYRWLPIEKLQEPGTLSAEQIAIVERLLNSTKYALKFDTLQRTFASLMPDTSSNTDRLPWSYYWLVKSNIVRVLHEGQNNARVITMVLGAPQKLDGADNEMAKRSRSATANKQKRNRSEATNLTPVHERYLEQLIRLTVSQGYPPTRTEAEKLKDKDTSEVFKVPYFKLRELIGDNWVDIDSITDTVELKTKAIDYAVKSMKINRKKVVSAVERQHPMIERKHKAILSDIKKMQAAG